MPKTCVLTKNTENKSCYNKIDNGWDETKQNQGKPEPGVAVALVVGVPGNPPVPHQVCYCTTD